PAARVFRMLVPDVRGREFATRTIVVPNVPVSPAARLNLRVWALHSSGERFTLSFASGGRTIAQNSFTTGPDGFFTVGDLMHEFPELAGRKLTADVIITLDGDDRLWHSSPPRTTRRTCRDCSCRVPAAPEHAI